MLNRGVMAGLVNGFSDFIAKIQRFLVLVNIFGGDDPGRITGPRGGYRVIKRILKRIFEFNDRFGGKS